MIGEIKPKFSKDENVMTLPDGRVFDAVKRDNYVATCIDCDMRHAECYRMTEFRCCPLLDRAKEEFIIWKLRKP